MIHDLITAFLVAFAAVTASELLTSASGAYFFGLSHDQSPAVQRPPCRA
jgi:hypothetical protein